MTNQGSKSLELYNNLDSHRYQHSEYEEVDFDREVNLVNVLR